MIDEYKLLHNQYVGIITVGRSFSYKDTSNQISLNLEGILKNETETQLIIENFKTIQAGRSLMIISELGYVQKEKIISVYKKDE